MLLVQKVSQLAFGGKIWDLSVSCYVLTASPEADSRAATRPPARVGDDLLDELQGVRGRSSREGGRRGMGRWPY